LPAALAGIHRDAHSDAIGSHFWARPLRYYRHSEHQAFSNLYSLLAFALGYITASVIRADKASKRALTIEVGIQNSGLGIVILLTQLGGVGGAGAVAGLWGVWHEAKQTLDAKGHIVTPGFIDLHTHYDGQVSWDDVLQPSVNHGVTTAVMGNCGVGFAPCRAEDRDKLIRLMEGVEDIPGTALHEGMDWQWERFPEYLDALDAKPRTINIAAMVPHDPLRVYAMGDRAGISTGRSDFHKSSDGDWTPASEAGKEELEALAQAVATSGHGVLQAVNDFDMVRPGETFDTEFALMEAFFRAGKADGLDVSFQVAPRAIGAINGLNCTFHPIMGHPSYIEIAEKPLSERVEILRDPEFKAQLLSESPVQLSGFPVYNYTQMNYDNVLTMMRHPKALPGLSDGGAHVGTICDASFPTYLIAHWTRDRLSRGKPGITLPRAIQMLTADAADYLGLSDRGRIAVGTGYMATYVNGERVIANDQVTEARPGKLVRSKPNA